MRARSVHLNRGLAVGASNKTALHPRYFLPHLHQQGAASRYNYIITAKKRPSSHLSPVAGRAVRREKTAMEAADIEFTEERPFFEPAVRSFALGVGTGVLLEVLHVCSTLGYEASTTSLSTLLPQAFRLDELDPLVFWDNLVAMSGFAASYGLEVAAIVAVLKQFPDDSKKATHAIMNLSTIPKALMPNLPQLRRSLYSLLKTKDRDTISATSAATVGSPTASGSSAAVSNNSAFSRASASPAPSAAAPPSTFSDAGEVLLDRSMGGAIGGVPFPPLQGPPSTSSTPPKSARSPLIPSDSPPAKPSSRTGLAPGAWNPSDQVPSSLRRARELWERRGYLKNFWYCVAMSHELGSEEPLEVKILGRKVALFRDAQGKAHCLDNVCPHRGAPLAQGWVKDVSHEEDAEVHSCVVCPYHGWAFDTAGKLREVPSTPDKQHLPKRSLVASYTLPSEERPPIPFVPELEDPSWQPVFGKLEFEAPHWSVFDNAIDMAHIHYLHADSFGNESKPEVMDMQMSRDTFSVHGTFKIHNKPVNALWEWTSRDAVPVEVVAFLPSTSFIKITLGAGVQMITFVNTVPIDADRSINRFCLIRNFAGWDGFDLWARNAMFKILGEDKEMVEQLQPEQMRAEVSLGADLPQVFYRQLRSEWANMGYIADPDKLHNFDGLLDM